MTSSRDSMCKQLSSLGWRQTDVHAMVDKIEHWKASSGEQWTVNRLKAMKQSVLNNLAGIPSSSDWISRHPGGSFKGPFKALDRLTTFREKVRVLNTIMVYSTMISTSPTPSQWQKFQQSAEHSPPEREVTAVSIGAEKRFVRDTLPSFGFSEPDPTVLDDLILSEERRAPSWSPKKGRTITVPEVKISEWLPLSCDSNFVRRSFSKYPEVFANLSKDLKPFFQAMPTSLSHPIGSTKSTADSVGKVSFIQEPGFKLRAVANPNRIVQVALQPLQRQLFAALRKLKEDCTYDQGKGVSWVSEQLSEGHTCHSIDLSDATNNFPLRLQMLTLRELMPKKWEPWLNLFEDSSKGPWRVLDPSTKIERNFHWSKGQPLGLGPSFASFALGHHLLARMACYHYGKDHGDGDYRILGDDIVIVGEEAKERYLTLLSQYGCPVSASKTISSDRMAEFAGKIVLRDEGTISPFKWKATSDRSFIDTARNLGPGSIQLFRKRQRSVIALISEIPEEFGGLGWNPNGLSYLDRIEKHAQTIRALESVRDAVPYGAANHTVQKWRTNTALSLGFRDNPFLQEPASAVERPVPPTSTSPKSRILGLLEPRLELLDPDLDAIPQGWRPGSREGDPRGKSTLLSMEDKLDLSERSNERNLGPEL